MLVNILEPIMINMEIAKGKEPAEPSNLENPLEHWEYARQATTKPTNPIGDWEAISNDL